MGKVLKVIVVMRSLFIDRTIVKGYNENVYAEDGKVSARPVRPCSRGGSARRRFPEDDIKRWAPREMPPGPALSVWRGRVTKASLSPLAFFIKLLLFPLS